jgi:Recombination endonuclease VII
MTVTEKRIYDQKYAIVNRERLRAQRRTFRVANRARLAEADRAKHLKSFFGLTVDRYEAMLAAQGGVCALCGAPPLQKRLAVDHNHETGQIRGLLCFVCNRWLGAAERRPGLLHRTLDYLR